MFTKLSVDQMLLKAKSFEKKGKFLEAKELYQTVLKNFSKNKRAHYGLMALNQIKQNYNIQSLPLEEGYKLESFYNQGQFSLAFKNANSLIKRYPKSFLAWNILSISAVQIGNLEAAIKAFEKVISINPRYAEAYNNLGVILKNQGKLKEAFDLFERALQVKPEYIDAYYNLGNVLKEQGKLDESIEAFKKAISLKPDYAEAYCNLGVVFKDQGKFNEAISAYKKSITFKSNNALSYSNIGSLLQNQGKLDEATEAYKKSISIDPNLANAHKNLSFTLLSCGQYKQGLDEYEWRWKTDESLSKYRHFRQPLWNKEISLKGKTILIWSEQGVGDTITWSSCLSHITSQAKHCILECQEKLVPLLKRSFPKIEVKAENRSLDEERNDFDFHISMGSLYKNLNKEIFLKTKVDAYLVPDPDRVDYWRKKLESLGNGPYIGVSWKSVLMSPDRIPNYAPISEWSSLLKLPNIKFINLQPKDFEEDLSKIKNEMGVKVHNFEDIDHWDDLDDVAALCTALDMVVSNKITVPLIAAGVGTLTKLANWKQSAWNNILLNPRGPLVQIYEKDTWENWDNVFKLIADDILKLNSFNYTKNNITTQNKNSELIVADDIVKLKDIKNSKDISCIQNPPSEVISELLSLYNNGQFFTVVEKAQLIIEQYPKGIDIWNILAVSAYKTQMMDKAIKAYEEVILLKPDFPAAYNNMAVALLDIGKIDKAIEVCNKAISLKPNYVEAYKNLGNAYKNQGKFFNSIEAYEKAISLKPDYAELFNNLGNAYQDQGKLDDSIKAYEKAISLKPDYAEAYNNLGNTLINQGKLEEAQKKFKKTLLFEPNHISAHNNLGFVLANQGMLDEAIKFYKKAITLNPDYVDAYINLGKALRDLGEPHEAIDAFEKAILIKPNYAHAYNNLGTIFNDQGNFVEAINSFEKAILINPNFALAFNNMGVALKDLGKMNEAIDAFKKALSLEFEDSTTHKNLSYALLNSGELQEGLNEYEWRWKTQKFLQQKRNFLQPMWDGKESLSNKTLLLWCEQGIGDTISWSSSLSLMASKAKYCILECQEKLLPLLKRSFPNIDVKAEDRSLDTKRNDFDFHLPMGSIYKNFVKEISRFDKSNAYLIPDPVRVDHWKRRLKSLGNGPYIGVSWKSSNLAPERLPHYANISDFSAVLKIPNTTFINLQYNDFEDDLKKITDELGIKVHNFDDLDHYNDIDDVAALCLALDMVVSTKITVPFISAAVGTSTKLANWKQSPWNNVLSNLKGPKIDIFDRNTWEPWDDVFSSIAEDILNYSNKRNS